MIKEVEGSDNEDYELTDYNVKITDIFENWKKNMLKAAKTGKETSDKKDDEDDEV